MWRGVLIVGVLLLAVSGFIVMVDSDNLSGRMPTQVVPRRYAVYPFALGAALVVVGLVGLATN